MLHARKRPMGRQMPAVACSLVEGASETSHIPFVLEGYNEKVRPMSQFNDLAPLDYFGQGAASVLVAIGWLDQVVPFTLGAIDPKVLERLSILLENPFEPGQCLGFHQCDICQGQFGSRNLFIPGRGFLYVCPELIIHYIEKHNYLPPEPFCAAVMHCPDIRSRKYRRLFLSNGGLRLFEEIAKRIGGPDVKKTLKRLKRGAF